MMQKLSRLTLSCLALWLTLSSQALAVNLVSNGGFETGDFTAWSTQGATNNLFQVSSVTPHTGSYSVLFAELEVDDDEIYQTVPTANGQQYTLDFWVYNIGLGDDGMHVEWEGNTVFNLNPLDIPLESWLQYSLPLTATMDGSELRLGGFDVPLGFYVDDISLTAVPEPSSLLLAATALLALVFRRRRTGQ